MAGSTAFTLLGAVQVTPVGAITVITVALPAAGSRTASGAGGLALFTMTGRHPGRPQEEK